ncbi:MAG TPA: alpha/beta fold hydrolase [Mycobacteriales bacterium]|jgi:pimeloyl-ACP methyl ester carboxylesterase|nr:alpha/beta fold hydrolase [Mycobacteriales bacterium]
MTTFLKDELLDAQVQRTLGTAGAGGADLGECLAAVAAVDGTDLDSWHAAWTAVADRLRRLAEAEEAAGNRESARGAYLRAGSYYRTAGVLLFTAPVDPRLAECDARQREMFTAAFRLMDLPPERVRIPFEGGTLPGWFFPAAADGQPRATLILTGGYDGPCEELYLLTGAAALRRGYHVLAFDGPGQGAALLQQGLTMRPDWETVVAAAVDHTVARPEVDPERVALVGLSLGAHLAPRAASAEHRLAALVADCGAFSLYEGFLARMPASLATGLRENRAWARLAVRVVTARVLRKPTAGWALRRGMQVHGVRSPLAYLDVLRDYTLAGRAERITCPTWVCNAENDDIGASAPELVARLTCPHEFVRFTAADGAGDHCEAGARSRYHAESFRWLDALLRPREDSERMKPAS